MGFFKFFFGTLAILLAIFTFLIILAIITNLNQRDNDLFKFEEGSKQSNNVLAVLEIDGPIINETSNFLGLNVNGFIYPNVIKKKLIKLLDYKPKVIIIKINSPGGTVGASAKLYKIFKDFKSENEIELIFFTNQMLTSGAYWVANSGDRIIASYGSIIGSIGVSSPNWFYYNKPISISKGLFGETIETEKGVEVYSPSSGLSKDLYNPFRKPTTKEIEHLQNISDQIYENFINIVSKKRKIEKQFLKNEIGALIFNTAQAQNNYLIDEVMYFEDVIKQINKNNNYSNYKLIKNYQANNFYKNLLSFNSIKDVNKCDYLNFNILSILPVYLNNC